MDIVRKATIIYCKDISKSRAFYETVLGFSVELDLTSVVFLREGLALWEIKESHLLSKMFGKDFYQSKGKPFELYFEIKNWHTFVTNLENHKISYVHDAYVEPWGQRTIRFYDPDQNIVEVGESLEEFIKRLFISGKKKEEIAKLNGLPTEEINRILNISS